MFHSLPIVIDRTGGFSCNHYISVVLDTVSKRCIDDYNIGFKTMKSEILQTIDEYESFAIVNENAFLIAWMSSCGMIGNIYIPPEILNEIKKHIITQTSYEFIGTSKISVTFREAPLLSCLHKIQKKIDQISM